jgi:hypothetical protein
MILWRALAPKVVGLAFVITDLVTLPTSALQTPMASLAFLRHDGTKVLDRCTIWIGKCLHWWGPRSRMFGRCVRNHGCYVPPKS